MADGTRIESMEATLAAEVLIWLSPAFPTGAFAFSHGLERLADAGIVRDRATLEDWLSDLIVIGSLRNDLILLAASWRAASARDESALDAAAELAAALCPTGERRLETLTTGASFASAVLSAWPSPLLEQVASRQASRLAYPVAVGAAAGERGLNLGTTLQAYAIAFASNIVSAAIRLGLIGQFDGQRVLASQLAGFRSAAAAAIQAELDDLGGAMFLSDIASIEHETQYTRLFRS